MIDTLEYSNLSFVKITETGATFNSYVLIFRLLEFLERPLVELNGLHITLFWLFEYVQISFNSLKITFAKISTPKSATFWTKSKENSKKYDRTYFIGVCKSNKIRILLQPHWLWSYVLYRRLAWSVLNFVSKWLLMERYFSHLSALESN